LSLQPTILSVCCPSTIPTCLSFLPAPPAQTTSSESVAIQDANRSLSWPKLAMLWVGKLAASSAALWAAHVRVAGRCYLLALADTNCRPSSDGVESWSITSQRCSGGRAAAPFPSVPRGPRAPPDIDRQQANSVCPPCPGAPGAHPAGLGCTAAGRYLCGAPHAGAVLRDDHGPAAHEHDPGAARTTPRNRFIFLRFLTAASRLRTCHRQAAGALRLAGGVCSPQWVAVGMPPATSVLPSHSSVLMYAGHEEQGSCAPGVARVVSLKPMGHS
jgi:hypothetical protein